MGWRAFVKQVPHVWILHRRWGSSKLSRALVFSELFFPAMLLLFWYCTIPVLREDAKKREKDLPLYAGWPTYQNASKVGVSVLPPDNEQENDDEMWLTGHDIELVEDVINKLKRDIRDVENNTLGFRVWDSPEEMLSYVNPTDVSWYQWQRWYRAAHRTNTAVVITSRTSYTIYTKGSSHELFRAPAYCEVSTASKPFFQNSLLLFQLVLEAALSNSSTLLDTSSINITRYSAPGHVDIEKIAQCRVMLYLVQPLAGFLIMGTFTLPFVRTLFSTGRYLFNDVRGFLDANGMSEAAYLTTFLINELGPKLVCLPLFALGIDSLLLPGCAVRIWLFLSVFMLSLPSFCGFLSLFMPTETVAATAASFAIYYFTGGAGIFVGTCENYGPQSIVPDSNCFVGWQFVALFPPAALCLGSLSISYEQSTKYYPADAEIGGNPGLAPIAGMLVFDIVLYSILTFWIYGALYKSNPLLFPIKAEQQPPGESPGVAASNLFFRIKGREILKRINIKVARGERLALLGHNGAGKTTLLKALTGCITCSGETSLYGLQVPDACGQGLVGFSPQQNLPLTDLTVAEILGLACSLKGVPYNEVAARAEKAAEEVGLKKYLTHRSENLGTGEKRKLSVAFALAGDPPILILDEPTAGLDPHSRRQVWSLISSRKNCTVLYTTHQMDEAYLADSVAVMYEGCLPPANVGTIAEIKNSFNHGQRLDIVKNHMHTPNEPILSVVGRFSNSFDYDYTATGRQLSIALPETQKGLQGYGPLFKILENTSECAVLDVESFSIRLASFEDLLLSGHQMTGTAVGYRLPENEIDIPLLEMFNGGRVGVQAALLTSPAQFLSIPKQVLFIAWQKTASTLRSRGFFVYQFIAMFTLLCAVTSSPYRNEDPVPAPVLLSPNMTATDPSAVFVGGPGANEYMDLIEALPFGGLLNAVRYSGSFEDVILYSTPFAFEVVDNQSVNIWFNASVSYGVPFAVQYVGNLMRKAQGHDIIEGTIGVFPGVPEPAAVVNYGFAALLLTALSSCSGIFVGWLVAQRKNGARHLSQLCGVHDTTFYVAKGLSDVLALMVINLVTLLFICLYSNMFWDKNIIMALLAAFLAYSPAVIASGYAVGFMFTSPSHATLFFVFYHYVVANQFIRDIGLENERDNVLKNMSPLSLMADSVMYFLAYGDRRKHDALHKIGLGPMEAISGNILGMIYQLVFWSVMLMVGESSYKLKNIVKRCFPRPDGYYMGEAVKLGLNPDKSVTDMMRDVELNSGTDKKSLFVRQLRKVYCSTVAVSGMYLKLKPGMCFGLISPSGAGKSTAMRMIAGLLPPSQGEVTLNGLTNLHPLQLKEMHKLVGYLPQTDPLPPELSVERVLLDYAKLRNIKGASVDGVRCLLAEAGIAGYASATCDSLSGGLKRLVALLLALMGSPKVLVLDEPTAAMDPYMRRVAWRLIGDVSSRPDPPIIILTTCSLTEADAACTDVGVMVQGNLTTVGSTGALKEQHASGYFVTARVSCSEQTPALGDHLVESVPECAEMEFYQKHVEFKVHGSMGLAKLIDMLEALKSTHGVNEYTISKHSFEHAYLRTIEDKHLRITDNVYLSGKGPSLRVCMLVVGSRGDVQPFVAMARRMKQDGHTVKIVTHPCFETFVTSRGIEFGAIGGDPEALMKFMVEHPSMLTIHLEEVRAKRSMMTQVFQHAWTEASTWSSDVLISNPPVLVHAHIAEALHIPLQIFFTMPWSPTKAYRHPLAMVSVFGNEQSYGIVEELTWLGMGDIINNFREAIGLHKLRHGAGIQHTLNTPHIYCISEAIVPRPSDWEQHISISGFWFLNEKESYTPSPELARFLASDGYFVYIGFGSIVVQEVSVLEKAVFTAIDLVHEIYPQLRVIITPGWANLGSSYEGSLPDHIFLLDKCPHDWLFPRCNAVVHHGGAGTTAAGLNAGVPTVVVPFFGDQPFWGRCCERQGVGPAPVSYKSITGKLLAKAMMQALTPEMSEKAKELSTQIATEQGLERGLRAFYDYLPFDDKGWCVTVVENQRWFPMIGWSMTMALGDPPAFSDESGVQSRKKEGFPCPPGWAWQGDWAVKDLSGCKDGFRYATSFKGPWRDTPGSTDTVRRRTWTRARTITRTVQSRVEILENENARLRAVVQAQADALQRMYTLQPCPVDGDPVESDKWNGLVEAT
eukprot:TRINITY_DN14391_c0_g1_i1.p1 TRINITY_DN14391_c0_g1~~TRINITY_DN14391_c0_g1_i1.p1  ORF type:complete len:2164 (+),score=284.35 TRINITY_DN14391_c0_g1_i1:37-6528(+)